MTYTAPQISLAHSASKVIQTGGNGFVKVTHNFTDALMPNILPNSTTGAYEADE